MTAESVADVDAYIASAPEVARPALTAVRDAIRGAVPDAEERIAWGVPFYRRDGDLAGFAVYARHVSFGLPVDLDADTRAEFRAAGCRTGKKTAQIRFDAPVPSDLIARLVRAQAERNAAGA